MSAKITALPIEVNRSRSAAAGLDPSQYAQVTAGLTDLAQWPAAFLRAAEGHLDLARQAESRDRAVSAAQSYRDASRWFHFATCVPDADAATVRGAEARAADALRAALILESRAGEGAERIQALDSYTPFVALIQRPTGITHPPAVIVIPGLDSSKEEFQTLAAALRRRGPGDREHRRPPAKAKPSGPHPRARSTNEWLPRCSTCSSTCRTSLTRVAAMGLSLGGYYVARPGPRTSRG